MKLIESSLPLKELQEMAETMYGTMVKGVVDIRNNRLVLDAEMHVDEEQFLLEKGSLQNDLWGINLHPEKYGTDEFIEFDSMINIRPSLNNRSRSVEDPELRENIINIVSLLITK